MRTSVGMSSGFTVEKSVAACGVLPVVASPGPGAGVGAAALPLPLPASAVGVALPAAEPEPFAAGAAFFAGALAVALSPVPAPAATAIPSDDTTTAILITRISPRCANRGVGAISFGLKRL